MMNFQIDCKSIEDDAIQIQSRSMSDPTLSDIDLKKIWLWSELPSNCSKSFLECLICLYLELEFEKLELNNSKSFEKFRGRNV